MATVVVTGADGFIGTYLTTALLRRGHAVRTLSRAGKLVAPGSTALRYSGLADRESLDRAMAGATAVVHLAGLAHMLKHESATDRSAYTDVNVDGTRNVAEAAARAGIEVAIFSSSVKAVADVSEDVLNEHTVPMPSGVYGISKLQAEQTFRDVAVSAGMRGWILRMPLVIGPGAKGNVLRLIDALRAGRPLPLIGSANARSMIGLNSVSTLVDAIIRSTHVPDVPYFVSDGVDVSTETFMRKAATALGVAPRLLRIPSSLMTAAAYAGDVVEWARGTSPFTRRDLPRLFGSLRVDSRPLRRVLNDPPLNSLDAELQELVAWYRARKH